MLLALQNVERFHKTRMCRYHRVSRCYKDEGCTHAHSVDELLGKPDLRKTALCRSWKASGSCINGDHCTYAHGAPELRESPRPINNEGSTCYGSPTASLRSRAGCSLDEDRDAFNSPELSLDELPISDETSPSENPLYARYSEELDQVRSSISCSEAGTDRTNTHYSNGTHVDTPVPFRVHPPYYDQDEWIGRHWVYYPAPMIMKHYCFNSCVYCERCPGEGTVSSYQESDSSSPRSLVDFRLDL